MNEARRSPASLPWCAVRAVADNCPEKAGTTKEAGATKGVLAKYKKSGSSHSQSVRLPQIGLSMRILCGALDGEDRSQKLLVRCVFERGLGDQSDAFRMSMRSELTNLSWPLSNHQPLRRVKEIL